MTESVVFISVLTLLYRIEMPQKDFIRFLVGRVTIMVHYKITSKRNRSLILLHTLLFFSEGFFVIQNILVFVGILLRRTGDELVYIKKKN